MNTLITSPLSWTKIADNVFTILGHNPSPMCLEGTNTYILGTGKRRILIDAGEENWISYQNILNDFMKENDVEIEKIIITHFHHDHIGGTDYLVPLMKSKGVDVKVYKKAGDNPLEIQFLEKTGIDIVDLNDDDIIEVEGAKVKVIYSPGHSSDHICLLMEEQRLLFTGDLIIGTTSATVEDMIVYMTSLQKIRKIAEEAQVKTLCLGHGSLCNTPLQKIDAYIKYRLDREEKIISLIKDADNILSYDTLIMKIYPTFPTEKNIKLKYNMEKIMQTHLEKLIFEQRIQKLNENVEVDAVYYKCISDI